MPQESLLTFVTNRSSPTSCTLFPSASVICFQPSKEKEIFEVMQEAVGVRNDLFAKAMNPAEPHNPSLVRKHYAALRAEMDDVFGKLFEKLSKINEQK